MKAEFLAAYVQNALIDNEELLPRLLNGTATRLEALGFCANDRMAAVGMLFLSGRTEEFQRRLFQSGRAWAHFLERAPAAEKRGGDALPLLDAVSALDWDGAARIAAAASHAWTQGAEYEEDFLFPEFLSRLFFLGAPEPGCAALLARWDAALQGTDDPRLDLCRGLLARDADAFGAGLERFLEERRDRWDQLEDEGALSPEEQTTVARISLEGLALVRLAERRGIATDAEIAWVPSLARPLPPPPFPPDDWKNVDPY